MTVQELIDALNKVEDKTKQVRYSELIDIDENGCKYYNPQKFDTVYEGHKEVFLEYNFL